MADGASHELKPAAAVPSVLERPAPDSELPLGERVAVRGWLMHTGVAEVTARWAEGPAQTLTAAIAREDLGAAPRGCDPAQGFDGFLPTTGLGPGEYQLQVSATAGGRLLRSWSRRVRLESSDTAYKRWRRALPAAPLPAHDTEPCVTWFVGEGDTQARALTLASVREAGPDAIGVALAHPMPDVSTPYAGLLRAGDRLHATAMRVLACALRQQPDIDVLYADHDHLSPDGEPADPVFKTAWSPLLAHEPLLWDRGWVARSALFRAAHAEPERWAQRLGRPGLHIAHLPWPLTCEATARPAPGQRPAAVGRSALTSAIVPTRLSDPAMLARCLDGLAAASMHGPVEIVVVLNNLRGHDEAGARAFLSRWNARVVHADGPFNWSALNNQGAAQATGDWLLFINDDVEPLAPDWLAAMHTAARHPGVGCVGALLRYADGSIQHAGVWLDGRLQWAGRHVYRHASGHEPRVARWLGADREHTAVTGACLLTSRRCFDAVGGFDDGLPVVFNDVDYCLRLRQLGWRSVVAAGAELIHHESVSRGGIPERGDHIRFRDRWSPLLPMIDPFWHPCLGTERDDALLDPASRPPYEART
jgi:O-antigen biosynthesis protein